MRLLARILAPSAAVAVFAAQAFAHGGMTIGRTADGKLVAFVEQVPPFVIPVSELPPFPGWAGFLPSFTVAEIDEPANGFFKLSEASNIDLELISTAQELLMWTGTSYMPPGTSINLGSPYFDIHYIFHVPSGVPGEWYPFTFRLHDRAGVYTDSEVVTIYFTPDYCPSDFNRDGFSDAIDYDVFVEAWVGQVDVADVNVDGFIDAIDLDLFINAFVRGC